MNAALEREIFFANNATGGGWDVAATTIATTIGKGLDKIGAKKKQAHEQSLAMMDLIKSKNAPPGYSTQAREGLVADGSGEKTTDPKKKKDNTGTIIAIVVGVLLIAVVAFFALSGKKKK